MAWMFVQKMTYGHKKTDYRHICQVISLKSFGPQPFKKANEHQRWLGLLGLLLCQGGATAAQHHRNLEVNLATAQFVHRCQFVIHTTIFLSFNTSAKLIRWCDISVIWNEKNGFALNYLIYVNFTLDVNQFGYLVENFSFLFRSVDPCQEERPMGKFAWGMVAWVGKSQYLCKVRLKATCC